MICRLGHFLPWQGGKKVWWELERRTSRRDVQHPTASFPLAAKPLEGEGVAAKRLRSRPELRRMGGK